MQDYRKDLAQRIVDVSLKEYQLLKTSIKTYPVENENNSKIIMGLKLGKSIKTNFLEKNLESGNNCIYQLYRKAKRI